MEEIIGRDKGWLCVRCALLESQIARSQIASSLLVMPLILQAGEHFSSQPDCKQ